MTKKRLKLIKQPRLYSGTEGMGGAGGSQWLQFASSMMQSQGNNNQGSSGMSMGNGTPFSMLMHGIDSSVQTTLGAIRAFTEEPLENPHRVALKMQRGYDNGGYLDPYNKYNVGGALEVANVAAKQVSEVAGMWRDVKDRSKVIQDDIKDNAQQITNKEVSSTEELLDQWSSFKPIDHVKWKDLTNKGTAGSFILDAFSMSSEGAAAGSSLGPIGAIAGGVGGLISGITGNILAGNRARKEAKKINQLADQQNRMNQASLNNMTTNLEQSKLQKELQDFTGWEAAYGGPLHKYSFGGNLMTNGAIFNNGFTLIGNGGTHEQNPNEGVLMGIDAEGVPNLVEEGEVIFDDYVFSKRLKVPETIRKSLKLGNRKKLSFAEAALKASKESEERPNDPISQLGFEDTMTKLVRAQEEIRNTKKSKKSKQLLSSNRFDEGGYPGNAPYAYLPGQQYKEAWGVENPYSKIPESNTIPIQTIQKEDAVPERMSIKIPESKKSPSGRSTKLVDSDTKYPQDSNIKQQQQKLKNNTNNSNYTPEEIRTRMAITRGTYKPKQFNLPETNLNFYEGSNIKDPKSYTSFNLDLSKDNNNKNGFWSKVVNTLGNIDPAIASQGMQALSDLVGLTNRPQYTLGSAIKAANNQIRNVSTRSAGRKIAYKPTDMWQAINNFNANMAAQRSAIRNAGNRVATTGALLASAYNQNKALGELYAGMEKENWERYTDTIARNNLLDQADRDAEFQASVFNAGQGTKRANNLIEAAKANDKEEQAYASARQANRDNFINSLSARQKEGRDWDRIEWMAEKGLLGDLTAKDVMDLRSRKNGGKINRKKKKRGLTY